MADDRTRNQTSRVTEAAVEATKAGSRANVAAAGKGAETTQRAIEANVEEATRTNADIAGKSVETAQRAVATGIEQVEQVTHTGAEVSQRIIEAGTDQGRRVAEASVQETRRVLEGSSHQLAAVGDRATQAALESTQRTSETLDVMVQVATTAASGGQSIAAELVDYGQQAFKRNVDAFNKALRVRSATDLLNIQTGYLHDSLGAMLSTSARISEISAKTATDAVGKLQQRRSA
jgi:hypothetical protein